MGNETYKRFTLVIENYSSFGRDSEIYSDIFVAGRCKWRLIAYPGGTNKYEYGPYGGYLSLYVCVPDSESLPSGWRRHARISFRVVNHIPGKVSRVQEEECWFDQNNTTWGFKSMMHATKVYSSCYGFMVNGQVKIVAEVNLLEVIGKLDVPEETMGVPASQVESVSSIFEKYPGFASKLCPQILCKSPTELSNGDLAEAYSALRCVTEAEYKLNWLEKKLKETGETRLQEIEEELKDLKMKCADMDALLDFLRLKLFDD